MIQIVQVFYYQDECPKGTTQSSLWSYENQNKNNNDTNYLTKKTKQNEKGSTNNSNFITKKTEKEKT